MHIDDEYSEFIAVDIESSRLAEIPAGLGPWESALWQAKTLAHATGRVSAPQTDAWAIRVDESGLGFWGSYSATGEFVPFFPVGTPAGFVALAKRVYV
jgi:hypothetical protein